MKIKVCRTDLSTTRTGKFIYSIYTRDNDDDRWDFRDYIFATSLEEAEVLTREFLTAREFEV